MLSPKSQAVISYREKYPCVSEVDIGDKFEISKQRVSQILKRAGLRGPSVKHGQRTKCPVCGLHKSPQGGLCRACYKERHLVTCICANCGKVFERRQCDVLRNAAHGADDFYCSKTCWGETLGNTKGLGAHPENIYRR